LWFVSHRGEVVCLDAEGFHDSEDDGPIRGEWDRLFNDKVKQPNRLEELLDTLKRGRLTNWLRWEFDRADMPLPSNAMVVSVEDGKRWKITAQVRGARRRFELRLDGTKLEAYKAVTPAAKEEADVVWRFDLRKELKVFPFKNVHANANQTCSPAAYRDRIYVVTGNGTEQKSPKIPAPDAPSLVCFDKLTGKVLWTDSSPGENILEGQFSSPLVVEIDGRAQVIVGQGDGWVRSFDALTGKLIWKFDINRKESKWRLDSGDRGTRNSILATPVFCKGRVYIGGGQVLEHGEGPGRLVCIDPRRTGDISSELAVDANRRALPHRRYQAVLRKQGEKVIPNPNSGLIWEYSGVDQNENGKLEFEEGFHCTISSVVIKDDLLVAVDVSGLVSCFHARTGERHWVYDVFCSVNGSPLIVDDRVYVPDEDGDVAIFRFSSDPDVAMKKVDGEYRPLAEISMDSSVDGSPVFANGVLYIPSGSTLWAIAKSKAKPAPVGASVPHPITKEAKPCDCSHRPALLPSGFKWRRP